MVTRIDGGSLDLNEQLTLFGHRFGHGCVDGSPSKLLELDSADLHFLHMMRNRYR